MSDLWSWVLTLMGVTCFYLAGRKVWWAWYVGLATQAVWLAYSIATAQWGFLVGCVFYTAVYVKNAYQWTAERHGPSVRPRVPVQVGSIIDFTRTDSLGGEQVVASLQLKEITRRLDGGTTATFGEVDPGVHLIGRRWWRLFESEQP